LGRGPPPNPDSLEPPLKVTRRSGALFDEEEESEGLTAVQVLTDIAHNLDLKHRREEEEKSGRVGTLQSISKEDEYKLLAARGCGRYQVAICPDDVGRQFAKELMRVAEHSSALFKHHRWPTLINWRIAYGLATGSWGGKSVGTMSSWALGVGDWVTCPEELFDDYTPPPPSTSLRLVPKSLRIC